MWLSIDPRSSVPIYQQIVDAVKERVAKGALASGARLPTIRELAVDLTINPNTIAKAYQELERAGVIEVIRGKGTFVCPPKPAVAAPPQMSALHELMTRLLVEAHHLGVTPEYVLATLQDMIDRWPAKKEEE